MVSLRGVVATVALLGGMVATVAVGGFAAVGCGGDTGPFAPPEEAGADDGVEGGGGSDGTVLKPDAGQDSGRETSVPDAQADATDGGGGGDAVDVGTDGNATLDAVAAADSGSDGDAAVRPGDAGDAIATADVAPIVDVGIVSADAMIVADVVDASSAMDAAETGADATVDAGSAVDSGVDVEAASASDAASVPDAMDAAVAADASDAGNTLDAADAADAPDGKVIPPGLLAYPGQYATAICSGFANCCGSTFDVAKCRATFTTQGYDNTLPENPTTYGNGNLTFSQTQAAACISALQNWPCGATITSVQSQVILQACHAVFGGTIPIGSTGCLSSFECASGAYCDPSLQKCTALIGSGGTCNITGESADHQCGQINSALPPNYCNAYPAGGGASSGTGTCQPVQANGARCSDGVSAYSDYACANQLCDFANTATCVPIGPNPADPVAGFECGNFVIDAGGGG